MCKGCKNCTCGEKKKVRVCPICGQEYTSYPAISRKDNETEICPDCGMREALEDWKGFSDEDN